MSVLHPFPHTRFLFCLKFFSQTCFLSAPSTYLAAPGRRFNLLLFFRAAPYLDCPSPRLSPFLFCQVTRFQLRVPTSPGVLFIRMFQELCPGIVLYPPSLCFLFFCTMFISFCPLPFFHLPAGISFRRHLPECSLIGHALCLPFWHPPLVDSLPLPPSALFGFLFVLTSLFAPSFRIKDFPFKQAPPSAL